MSTEPTWDQEDTLAAGKFNEWLEHQSKLEFYTDIGEYMYEAYNYDKEHSLYPKALIRLKKPSIIS